MLHRFAEFAVMCFPKHRTNYRFTKEMHLWWFYTLTNGRPVDMHRWKSWIHQIYFVFVGWDMPVQVPRSTLFSSVEYHMSRSPNINIRAHTRIPPALSFIHFLEEVICVQLFWQHRFYTGSTWYKYSFPLWPRIIFIQHKFLNSVL